LKSVTLIVLVHERMTVVPNQANNVKCETVHPTHDKSSMRQQHALLGLGAKPSLCARNAPFYRHFNAVECLLKVIGTLLFTPRIMIMNESTPKTAIIITCIAIVKLL
jgi:hypothetical protein